MSATMVGRRRKIKKQWLKHPKAVPKFFFQNSGIPFLKILFRAYNVFIFVQTFQWTSSEIFLLISEFLAESLKTKKKNYQKRSHILQYSFAKKISLILRTLTHLTLKMIFFRNTVKNLSDSTNVPANMFICTTPFLDAQELCSWSTLKANLCIFLISLKKKIVFET